MPCTACHITAFGPSLTPEGEAFKLLGYRLGRPGQLAPLNLLALGSFSHAAADLPDAQRGRFDPNDNAQLERASVVYAGPVGGGVGALAEVRYDGAADALRWGNVDIRYADSGSAPGGGYGVWGLTLNNNPTVQDLWNTSPAWAFPFVRAAAAPRPASAPLLEEGLAHRVYGLSAYALLQDHLYLELGAYRGLPDAVRVAAGMPADREFTGTAPYWRAAAMVQEGAHALRAGFYGLAVRARPEPAAGAATDRYTDFTYDMTYSYRGDAHYVKLQLAYAQEAQDLAASAALGRSARDSNLLRGGRATLAVAFRDRVTLSGSAFALRGEADPGLIPARPGSGSADGTPDSEGVTVEAARGSSPAGSAVLGGTHYRLGLQLTHYQRFNGGRTDYDGFGRDASDNDTALLYLWLAR